MATITRIAPLPFYCEFCTTWATSALRTYKGKIRYCDKIKKEVREHDKACEDFHMHQFIFCDKYNQQYDVAVCLARQDKQYRGSSKDRDDCSTCKQGLTVRRHHDHK
jgi:hypothetical protein